MRGMIKWKPFNSLLTYKDIKEISNAKLLKAKPIIMEDKINEINNILTEGLNNNLELEIKYWNINLLKTIKGKISKINTLEKYILINKTRIYFKNLINIKIL